MKQKFSESMGLHHQNQHCFPALSQKRGAGMAFRAQLFEGRLALNPGLNLIRVFFFLCSKKFSRIIFSVMFKASSHQLVDRKN